MNKRDNALIRKQEDLMKGVYNPIDKIEADLRKTMVNKGQDSETKDYTKELLSSSKDKFNNILGKMEDYKKQEKTTDVHEEKAKMGNGHKI